MTKAVIFDMDGVIIDSEKLYRKACTELVQELGGSINQELFDKQMGLKMEETQRVVVQLAGLSMKPEEFGREYIERFLKLAREVLVPNRGLIELLSFLKPRVKLAIASSTTKEVVLELMERIGVKEYFQVIVGGDEVVESKPEPQIYLKAAELLAVRPGECIVIEDSPSGIESAVNAGMRVLAVKHDENRGLDLSRAVEQFDDLEEVRLYLEKKLNG